MGKSPERRKECVCLPYFKCFTGNESIPLPFLQRQVQVYTYRGCKVTKNNWNMSKEISFYSLLKRNLKKSAVAR